MSGIPLKILVVDPDTYAADILCDSLNKSRNIVKIVEQTGNLKEVLNILRKKEINTVFIDPYASDINLTSELIFSIRQGFPEIVIVLYVDLKTIEQNEINFYEGKRARFRHYYKLNKGMPLSAFKYELISILEECQDYLAYSLSTAKIGVLQNEITTLKGNSDIDSVYVPASSLARIEEQLVSLGKLLTHNKKDVIPNSIFLSYRFKENEYVEGLRTFLDKEGFHIETGENVNTYISQAILQRIESCEFFLCLMTRGDEKKDGSFTVSPWLLEEKGAAIALNKKIVIMVEEGVVDIGGLQGDWQRINFTPKSFTTGVAHAIQQLKSFTA